MSLRTLEELETVIRHDATTDDAYLSTFDPAVVRQWQRLDLPVEDVRGEWRTRVPKEWIAIRKPRNVSAARRAALANAARARNLRHAS
jgi:hypothetical protein